MLPTSISHDRDQPSLRDDVFRGEAAQELVENRFLDVNPFDGNARLAAVGKRADNQSRCGIVQRHAFQHDHRILPAEFQRKRNQSLGRGNGDFSPRDRTACKPDVIHMPDEFAADVPTAVNDVQQIRIEPALDEQSCARFADSGVSSDGFTITALPARSAGIASAMPSRNG